MDPLLPPTQLTELFQYYTSEILDIFCPAKVVVSRPNDKLWVTEEMKNLYDLSLQKKGFIL